MKFFRNSKGSRTQQRRKSVRRAFVEQLEGRRLLAVTTPVLGSSNDVRFIGDAGADAIVFSVENNGLLQHNHVSGGFDSATDLDSVTPGTQSRLLSEITSLSFIDAGANDVVRFFGPNPFHFSNADLSVEAERINVGAGVVLATGSGKIDFNVERDAYLGFGALLTTVDGGINVLANAGGNTIGNFVGINVAGAMIETTGNGNIAINGTGGRDATSSGTHGIALQNGAQIRSTSALATAGSISINGSAGEGAQPVIGLRGIEAVIESVSGNILIEGAGNITSAISLSANVPIRSTGTGPDAASITVQSSSVGSEGTVAASSVTTVDGDVRIVGGLDSIAISNVTSTGSGPSAGTITITNAGTGGRLDGSLSSVDGDIAILGGSESRVDLRTLTSSGTGTDAAKITISGGNVRGFGAQISSVDGDISIKGTGGSTLSAGVAFSTANISSTGTGPNAANIELDGTANDAVFRTSGVVLGLTDVSSIDGDITIRGRAAGAGASDRNIGVLLDRAQVSSTGTTADAALVQIAGFGGTGTRANYGVHVGATTEISTSAGGVSISGEGGIGTSDDQFGVFLARGSSIFSTGTGPSAGSVQIDGVGGSGTMENVGVLSESDITTIDGPITIIGAGGTGTSDRNYGVQLTRFGRIESSGVGPNAGTILINGTGGNGVSAQYGIDSSMPITSVDGNIHIVGQGGNGSGRARGVRLNNSMISSTGTGESAAQVSIEGTGGVGGTGNWGVELEGTNSLITSIDGDISLRGTGGAGDNSHGLIGFNFGTVSSTGTGPEAANIIIDGQSQQDLGTHLTNSGTNVSAITSVDGNIHFTGRTNSLFDEAVTLPSVVGGPSTNGNITIAADSLSLTFADFVQSSGSLTIEPETPNTPIAVGAGSDELFLRDVDLAKLVDGFRSIIIGDIDNGTGPVNVDTAYFTDPVTIAGGTITDNAGIDVDAENNVVAFKGRIAPGQAIGALEVAGDFEFASGSSLEVEFGPAENDQLKTWGTVTIATGVALQTVPSNGFVPIAGEQFLIIDNDGSDPVFGIFEDLPEGAVIEGFAGSQLNAKISYLGLDGETGNDVVLTVTEANAPPEILAQAFFVDENQTAVGSIVASDPDLPEDSLSFSIVNSVGDNGQFSISPSGELTFVASPDFENPTDTGGTVGDNVYLVDVLVTDSAGASTSATMTVSVNNLTANITGTVFVDANENGLLDGGTESTIDQVLIELLDENGLVLDSDITSMGGVYGFEVEDEFAHYRIRETQPTGVDEGQAILGDADGNGIVGEVVDGVILSSNEMVVTLNGIDASDYDFAESGQAVGSGDTASIGFWQNKHGQALIEQGGSRLVAWLNTNFGNIFGTTFSDELGGDNSSEVARFYKDEFFKKKLKGTPRVDAQFMGLALTAFFTSSNLSGGDFASNFGLRVTATGIGTKVVNVGSSGAAFIVADNSDVSILSLLLATNALTGSDSDNDDDEDYSYVYDLDGDGTQSDSEKSLRAMANTLYSSINEAGDR